MLSENIKIAYDSLKKNFLRSFLTVTIISIGMMAIMGIITAIESIETSIPFDLKTSITLDFSCSGREEKRVVLDGSLKEIKKTIPIKITNKVIITGIDL